MSDKATEAPFDPTTITRPDPRLQTYYVLVSILTLAGLPFVLLPLLFKYHTLRYRLDDEGVSMSWGLLFRREIYLTYRRIQDIHVTRDILQRWLGLATIAIQTASGTAGAEMTIVGITVPERLRDYLYSKMRGARGEEEAEPNEVQTQNPAAEALSLLHEIRDGLRRINTSRT